jgi:hypothetical protein
MVGGPVVRHNILKEGHSGVQLLISWWPEAQEINRKGPEPRYTLQEHAPSNLHPPTSPHLPQFHCFLIVYSNFESLID